ncbi:MAG: flavodoxin family protein [Anaerolineae bacterium]|nr:flavodoxin family protein [Anaerolineae bacterium]
MTKVVAINGSPRMEKGNTAMVLTSFLQGMTDAGSDVELYYAGRLQVKPCTGEMLCWYENAGQCYIKDEMQALYPRLSEADILVLATPVYIPLPGEMQNLINRLCPLVEPLLETRGGRTRARFREHVKIRKIALVSTGGWWEKGNFRTVVCIAQELAENAGVEFAGAVLRPHASLMREHGELTSDGKAVLEAARRAGYELVQEGEMSDKTLEAIGRPLISEEELRHRLNQASQRAARRSSG